MELKDAIGVAVAWISEEHIFTFMLSSTFTARNIVKEKGDEEEVRKDLYISLGLSILTSLILGALFKSTITFIAGFLFGLLLYYIYKVRGRL
jgi:hypothetical protein